MCNFQCRDILLSWIIVEQEPTVLAVSARSRLFELFSLAFHISFLSKTETYTGKRAVKQISKQNKQTKNKFLTTISHSYIWPRGYIFFHAQLS